MMSDQDNDELRKLSTNTIWISAGIGGTLIVFTIAVLFVFGWLSHDLEVTALLGDSFGAINALFSCLAFAGVVVALILQASEFRLAWQERKDALVAQSAIARQQEFSSLIAGIQAWNELQSPGRGNTPASEWQFNDLRFLKLRFVNAAILDAALERMLQRSAKLEPLITAEPAVQRARERADYAAILGNIIIRQRNLLLDGWVGVEENVGFVINRTDVSIIRTNIAEMLDVGELLAAKNSQCEIGFCYSQVYKLCLSLESEIKQRSTQSETIGGMYEDHIVPVKLTPEFVTERLVVYTTEMLNEVQRLFDPISRIKLTHHD